jgi:hypothetical protein
MLATVGVLSAAALAAVPMLAPRAAPARVKACDASALRTAPAKSTVERLGSLRAPGKGRGVKPRVYEIEADLVGASSTRAKIELVVSHRGNRSKTMLLVLPSRGCAKRTPIGRAIRKSRARLVAACGAIPKPFTPLEGSVTITGVGFYSRPQKGTLAAPNGLELRPVLRLRATGCRRPPAEPPPQKPPVAAMGVSAATQPPSVSPPAPEPEPQPEPNLCTSTIPAGAIEDEANRAPGRVICLETAHYQEPRDALIVIEQHDVRVQAAPGAYPIVCGRFVLRGAGSSVAPDVNVDPTCSPYFNEHSPWNTVAGRYPASVPIPPAWLADFDGGTGTTPLEISRSWDHGKAIFKAAPADPVTATYRIADASQCFDDVAGCISWQPTDPTHRVADETAAVPERIPIPAGVRCPALPLVDNGHDRALTIVSADGKTAWELWHCTHAATPAEPWYTAAVATRWSLDPDDPSSLSRGYQDEGLGPVGSTSARGSGTPLVTTTVTPREAVRGIHHALGLTVVNVSNLYVNPPASHTDGCAGCGNLRYGMLFVLDPAFKPARPPRIGDLNVILALKRYGAFIVDRGLTFEIDGSPNEPTDPAASDALWSTSGLDLPALGIKPSDFRYVPTPGSPPATP